MIHSGKHIRLLCSMFLIMVILSFGCIAAAEESAGKQKTTETTNPLDNLSSQTGIITGFVEGFTMDSLYIDGTDYVMSKSIEYYSSIGNPVTKAIIKRGCRIKYVLSPTKEVEIIQVERGQDDDEW
ncbi:MAG: hypothetical protein WC799_07840 [Desulfobacteraceae bacterium]